MLEELLTRYPALSACCEDIERAAQLLIDCYRRGGKLLLCGNGGSCADCEHIVGIVDLANFINKMGGSVRGAGTRTITVNGVDRLHGAEHRIIPDRIEAGTYMVAAALTGGELYVDNIEIDHIQPIIAKLREIGVEVVAL